VCACVCVRARAFACMFLKKDLAQSMLTYRYMRKYVAEANCYITVGVRAPTDGLNSLTINWKRARHKKSSNVA
jgi:hypothetical protein